MDNIVMDGDLIIGVREWMQATGRGWTAICRKLKPGVLPQPFFCGSPKPCWERSQINSWLAGIGEKANHD